MSFEVPVKLMREGLGSVSYGSPSSASTPGIFSDANNGLSRSTINPAVVVLGEDIGQAGSPAKLISDREIPLNGFDLNFITEAGATLSILHAAGNNSALTWNPGATGQQFCQLLTIDGQEPGPNKFGNFQIGWLEQSFVNPDGQIDAVMTIGYNSNGGDGQLNPLEASFATVLESHFIQGSGAVTFEWYLTGSAYDGTVNRYMMLVADKNDGIGFLTWHIDQFDVNQTTQSGNRHYFHFDSTGTMELIGPAGGPGGAFSISTDDPFDDGALELATVGASDGQFNFIDASGNPNGFFQFQAATVFLSTHKALGFANFIIEVNEVPDTSRGFVYFNSTAGGDSVTFWNNNNNSFSGNTFFGNVTPFATAFVHLNASLGTPGGGPLKLTDSTPGGGLLAIPEVGLFEFDSGVLYFTPTAGVRKTVVLV